MSEIEALLGLYGAIDRAVVAGEADLNGLATLLGAYQGGAAIGWYDDQYLPWVEGVKERAVARERSERSERTERDEHAEPSEVLAEPLPVEGRPDYLAEALEPTEADAHTLSPRAQDVADALAAFPPEPVDGRMAARRLLAVTAAARAFPEHFGVGGSHAEVARRALVLKDPRDTDLAAAALRSRDTHERFAANFKTMSDWTKVVNDALRDGVLPDWFDGQQDAPPCVGRLVMRPDPVTGDLDPCTVMEAGFVTKKLTFEQAKVYLEPSNWQYPGSFWCRMERGAAVGADSWIYHETVATSCPPSTAAWTVSTDLQFWFSHPVVNEARVEYDFPPGLPTPRSDIEIDEGSLRIVELPDTSIEVTTTKRVRFAGSFDGAGLSMLMCATGYSSKLEDVIFSVATTPTSKTNPFPVPAPKGGPRQGGTVTTQPNANKGTGANTSKAGESLEDIAKDAAAFVESSLKDVAATCTSSMQSIQKGTYKVEDAWADGIKMWSKYTAGLTKALDLSTRAAKVVATPTPTDET
ncbi:MAG: hypothetical protein ACJ71Z_00385 [Aeromicrobium sp.]